METTATQPVATNRASLSAGRPEPGRPAQLLAALFDAHAPMVLGVCRGMLREGSEAEDAAQQTFLSAYASILSGRTPREPAPWLATIARNECRSRVQRQMREPLPVSDSDETSADPAHQAAQAAEVESLRLALAQLPRQQRRAFLLREFAGLSYDELAVALGVSEPAVESLLFRARQQLRNSLRAAVAAAMSVPAGLRDFFMQLTAGSPDGPTTLAKLGSAPLLAKLASVSAGAALVTAGAVTVLPVRHEARSAHAASATRHAVSVKVRWRAAAKLAPGARAQPVVAIRPQLEPRNVEHTVTTHVRQNVADVVERAQPESPYQSHAATSESSGGEPTNPVAPELDGSSSPTRGGTEVADSGTSGRDGGISSGAGSGASKLSAYGDSTPSGNGGGASPDSTN
jgi:RNA polymerase sigma-70 factor (ECF subfamily)